MATPTGRIAFLTEPGSVELRQYPLPPVEQGALLVEVMASGVCGSDVHQFAGRHPVKRTALGHEFVGRVIDASTRSTDNAGEPLQIGDRVTATYFQTCLSCRACARGDFSQCLNAYANLVRGPDEAPHFVATHATHYYIAPGQWVFKVPDGVPTIVAASANCALAQVLCGIDRGGIVAGEHIVIQGAGGLGLWATAVAKERGARVTIVDSIPERLETAKSFGADDVISLQQYPDLEQRRELIRQLAGGNGADAVLDVTGAAEALVEGIHLLRSGGRHIELGGVLPGEVVSLDVGYVTRNGIRVETAIRYHPRYLLEALRFIDRNCERLPFDRLIGGRYPLDNVRDALLDSQHHRVNRAAIVEESLEAGGGS